MSNVIKNEELVTGVREVLAQHGRIATDNLKDDDDLYAAGLTSLATVGIMLALEDRFNIEFPERMLGRGTFKSIETIVEAVTELAS